MPSMALELLRRLNDEFFAKPLPLCRIQWGQAIQSVLQKIDFGKERIHGETPFETLSFPIYDFTRRRLEKQQIPLKQVRLSIENHLEPISF